MSGTNLAQFHTFAPSGDGPWAKHFCSECPYIVTNWRHVRSA